MDLSSLLAESAATRVSEPTAEAMTHQRTPSYGGDSRSTSAGTTPAPYLPPKHIIFEYLLTETAQQRARLPMRVNIYPHDGTDSIITTVKNFYGLYDGNGVSFEDKNGNTLIARYENFEDKMVVYVRVVDEVGSNAGTPPHTASPRRPRLGPAFELMPVLGAQSISRPSSRAARKRSPSPMSGHRSTSVGTNRSRHRNKGRVGSIQGDAEYDSDSDGGNASVTSSRRGRMDVASADISVDNIVEGGRRKRARFDSSELPLFVPPQVPVTTSISSISPQRRLGHNAASPFQPTNQQTFSYSTALPSPQSYSASDIQFKGFSSISAANGYAMTARNGTSYVRGRNSISGGIAGILPTPDPTVGSVISDEDVALQLMRLGDASNFSTHGRTSTSTIDDAFSGKADAASSDEDSDDGSVVDDDLPNVRFSRGNSVDTGNSSDDYDHFESSFKAESDGIHPDDVMRAIKKARNGTKLGKPSKVKKWKVKTGLNQGPPGALLHTHDHDHSNGEMPQGASASINFQHFQQPMGEDEEDLSAKPRCQRCRKSKKGCDRQRPCGRCRDAGIGIEGCVSEDEGNGRKGRYGRHMGVPIKKGVNAPDFIMESAGTPQPLHINTTMAPPPLVGDKSKKRKR